MFSEICMDYNGIKVSKATYPHIFNILEEGTIYFGTDGNASGPWSTSDLTKMCNEMVELNFYSHQFVIARKLAIQRLARHNHDVFPSTCMIVFFHYLRTLTFF